MPSKNKSPEAALETKMKKIEYRPIGIIRTPFKEPGGMPIQAATARGVRGVLEILPRYRSGLKDLKGFSHIILLYHFHRAKGSRLTVTPFLDTKPRGIFATRAPVRPNPIGFSVVKLTGITRNKVHIENVDVLDGTPLLDIKPYIPEFDHPRAGRTGWLQKAALRKHTGESDSRFG
jgi:tRNA-Thr(GGU) m(6)t(6)A37 methyltransferase TsaA